MKHIKLFTTILVVALIAGVAIFHACKKEEAVKTAITQEWQEKIEYMDIPCVDFSRIKKDASKGEPMLCFESWEHYASVIDAMLDFSYNYLDTRVNEILQANPNIDEDELNLIIHNEGIYQFMPLYSFCNILQFEDNAFEELRTEEIQWMQDPNALNIENPFDEMGVGYIQSALHNTNGDVMIGGSIFNIHRKYPGGGGGGGSYSCATNKYIDNSSTGNEGIWPTYQHDGKKREFRALLHSCQAYSYVKTSVYFFNAWGWRIVWCCDITACIDGKRLKTCDPNTTNFIYFNKNGSVYASVCEKYCWYSIPNYLHPYGNTIINTVHTAPGSSALPFAKTHLGL